MASIVGDKWNNAEDSLTSVNASIATVTAQLNEASRILNEALAGIAICDNKAWGCVNKSGRHISTWRDWRDQYAPLVTEYKEQLLDLLEIQKSLTAKSLESAQSKIVAANAEIITADAKKAISEAESVQATATGKKLLIYIGIGAILIIGGIYAYKKFKKH